MALEIERREKEDIVILDVSGRIVLGDPASVLRNTLREITDSGVKNVILNLEKVDYIDSTGLGVLVMAATTLQKADGALKLLNLNRRNIELMVMTKLSTILEIFNDETDAINSFFPDRKINRFDILSFVKSQKGQ
jgi:anti-sigma B factor antagonist